MVENFVGNVFFLGVRVVETSLTQKAPIAPVDPPIISTITRSTPVATCPTV
ncbi:hypothetical protein DPMN_121958 [Dreissena polymorpha]|uniref:Uncharacterized protein n=1 Tax=Dreissena polymorpha TaxID=45954 RepID=A0A9D4GRI1_DREPO|nr:hypothetical protein DPMN_121958 [Dreissena polymorpha]